jgi:hypothetical protein
LIDCIYQRIPYVNVPVPVPVSALTFPFLRFSFCSYGSIGCFFSLYFRYLSICRFSYFINDSVAAIILFFFLLVFFWLLFVAGSFATFFLTGLFFDPLFRTVIQWTLNRLSVYPLLSPGLVLKICLCIVRGFLCFFLPAWGRRPLAQPPGRFFLFFYPITGFFSK